MNVDAGPLQGIRVVDLGQVGACPVVGVILANLGADVVKVEKVQGESMRRGVPEGIPWEEQSDEHRDDAPWMAFNQGKRAIAVDLKTPAGRVVVERLVRSADVLLHNFRPRAIRRMRLDYESLRALNPRLVYLNVLAYGAAGPMANWAGGDAWIQGFAGVVALQGLAEDGPYLAGPGVADLSGAFWGTIGVLAGLLARERTGQGQEVSTTLVGATMFLQLAELTDYLVDGRLHKKIGRGYRGSFPYGAYRAQDGDVVTFYGSGSSWPAFVEVLGLTHLLADERFDTQRKREQRRGELYPILDDAFSQRPRAEWQRIFRDAGLRVDLALDHAELVAHPQVEAIGAIREVDHAARGPIRMLNIPLDMSGSHTRSDRPPPLIGEHSREVAADLGFNAHEIDTMIAAGALREPPRADQPEAG